MWKGSHNPILRGRKRSPWLLTTYIHWDDPPSTPPFIEVFEINASDTISLPSAVTAAWLLFIFEKSVLEVRGEVRG